MTPACYAPPSRACMHVHSVGRPPCYVRVLPCDTVLFKVKGASMRASIALHSSLCRLTHLHTLMRRTLHSCPGQRTAARAASAAKHACARPKRHHAQYQHGTCSAAHRGWVTHRVMRHVMSKHVKAPSHVLSKRLQAARTFLARAGGGIGAHACTACRQHQHASIWCAGKRCGATAIG